MCPLLGGPEAQQLGAVSVQSPQLSLTKKSASYYVPLKKKTIRHGLYHLPCGFGPERPRNAGCPPTSRLWEPVSSQGSM